MLQLNAKLKALIDKLWDRFWSGGISNPLSAIEQITYLLFMKQLDELDHKRQKDAEFTSDTYTSRFSGDYFLPQDRERAKALKEEIKHYDYEREQYSGRERKPPEQELKLLAIDKSTLRWSHFKEMKAELMLPHVQQKVFPFIKDLNGDGSNFTRHMANAVFLIPSANLLQGAIQIIEEIFIEMERDAKEEGHLFQDIQGDVYEMLLNEISSAGKNGQFRTPRHAGVATAITGWTQTLNEKGAAVSKEFGAGTVVIAIVGATLGETAIVETPVYCPDSIIGITPFPKKATSEFIEFLLRLWKPRLKELAPDAARANLNLERLRPLQAIAPSIEEQEKFSHIARLLRNLTLNKIEGEGQLDKLFLSLQQRAFRGELDLSKVKLESEEPTPVETEVKEQETVDGIFHRPGYFPTPPELEAEMMDLEYKLDTGHPDSIPWNENYFKYRILSQVLRAPFSFSEIWDAVYNDMAEAEYDDVKDKIFEYVQEGLLEQKFDEKRKEIVFYPRA